MGGHVIRDSDVIDWPDDMLTYSEALAYARRKAEFALEGHPGMIVIELGVSLVGYRWNWYYKLGWSRNPVRPKDEK